MKRPRLYVDTSVFGGMIDEEFREPSLRLFERIQADEFIVLLSDETVRELTRAPEAVKAVWKNLPSESVEEIEVTDDMFALANAYVEKGILGQASLSDAIHVAAATVACADLIVSWNFKHIVNYRRIQLFNAENMRQGYTTIDIRSPLELGYDNENENI